VTDLAEVTHLQAPLVVVPGRSTPTIDGMPLVDRRSDYREPGRFEQEDLLKQMLLEAVTQAGVSDIYMQPGRPALVKVNGRMHALTRKKLDYAEIETMAAWVSGRADVVAKLAQGMSADASYEVFDAKELDARGDKTRYRFRVNLSAHDYRNGMGIQIVMRHIPSEPWHLHQMDLEPAIVEAMTPRTGICYVTGATGSGKTSLLSALMRYIAENDTPIQGNNVTGESPIEFKFDKLVSKHSVFVQSEIPRHFLTFADFVRADMRRAPGLIMVGEARDQETIEAAIEASNTGHPVWTTTHTKSVAGTIRRLVSRIDKDQQGAVLFDIIDTAQLVVSQTLVPRVGGGRYPLREFLIVNDALRAQFFAVKDPDRISGVIQEAVEKHGRSMASVAKEAFQKGHIPESAYKMIVHQCGAA